MKSIATKFIILILSALLFCSLMLGGLGIFQAEKLIEDYSERYMESFCEHEAIRLNAILNSLEQSVNIMALNTLDSLKTKDILQDDEKRTLYEYEMCNFQKIILRNTNKAIASYLRFNPKNTPPTSGIFLEQMNNKIYERIPTDFSKYKEDDIEHVGWYYVPVKTGKPIWMEPYQNKNIDIHMISYVIPLSKFGEEIGIVGMDVNFDIITSEIDKIKIYKSGFAYLENEKGVEIYNPNPELCQKLRENEDLIEYSEKLSNGMYIVLSAPKSEIYSEKSVIAFKILLFTILISVLFIVLASIISRRMINPLKNLTSAAEKISQGNLEVKIECDTHDEIKILANSFNQTVVHLKQYHEYINGLAFKDSLTGVQNKTSYDDTIKKINENISNKTAKPFAIAVFDANGLKMINDKFGHDYGNMLIINSCRMICDIFKNSMVFRIGGDEFIAILEGDDFENRNELFVELARKMIITKSNELIYERISIACGISIFDETKDNSVESVFKRADALMYENKRQMKIKEDKENGRINI